MAKRAGIPESCVFSHNTGTSRQAEPRLLQARAWKADFSEDTETTENTWVGPSQTLLPP